MPSNETIQNRIREEYQKCAASPEYFIRTYCFILNPKLGRKTLFDLYDFQATALYDIHTHQYNIILKSRQMGISTLLACYVLWEMLFKPSSVVSIISLKQETAKEVITKIRYSHDSLPSWLKQKLVEDNRLSITMGNASRVIAHSTTDKGSVSFAATHLIIDECALIGNAKELWMSSQPSLSAVNGKATLISTPRGVGNFFHDVWVGAESGTSQFHATRLPWNVHPDRDQAWRDKEGAALGNERFASQEYDCNFLTSGDTLLPGERIELIRLQCIAPIEKRNNVGLWVWELPKAGTEYFVCADVATDYGKDFSAAHVIDDTGVQVAELKMRMNTYDFGKVLVDLCKEYRNAILIVDRTGVGESVVQRVINLDYGKLVHASNGLDTVLLAENYKSKDVPGGVAITSANRSQFINTLAFYLQNDKVQINSERFVDELSTFVDDGRGRFSAASNSCNDDLVMSLAVGLFVNESLGRELEKNTKITRACVENTHKTRLPESPQPKQGNLPFRPSAFGQSGNNSSANPQDSWKMAVGRGGNFDLRELL